MDFLSWLPWIGGASTVGLVVLAIVAPSVLQVAAAWLTALSPVLKGLAEAIVEYAKSLWFGFLDMADNGKSIIFVCTLCGLFFIWGYQVGRPEGNCVVQERSVKGQVPVPVKKPQPTALDDFMKNFGL